jgi:signal transduction histidine kinase
MVRNDVWQGSEVYRLVNLLQRESQNASELLEHLPFAVGVIQAEGHLIFANHKYSAILGAEAWVRDSRLQRVLGEVVETKSARNDVRIGSYVATLLPYRADSAIVIIDPRDASPTNPWAEIVQAMDAPAYLMADDGVIHCANAALLTLTGRSGEDLVGAHISDVHGPDSLNGARSGGIRRSKVRTRSGEVLPVTLKVSALKNAEQPWSLVTVVPSSGEMRPVDADELTELEFVSGRMAHYLNNWLMIVLSATESLTKNFGSIEALRTDLDFISESTRRASGVARDLLAFSSCRPGPACLLNADEALHGMESLLRTITGQRTLAIDAHADGAYIRLAPGDLEAMLVKLVQNSTDATTVNGEITIETARLSPSYPLQLRVLEQYKVASVPHVRIRIADNGRGIPAEHHKSMFQPFFTTRPGALGLGMSAVHGIVRRAKGAIAFTSEVGKGTTIDLVLPEETK